jgi:2,2-dialkylglycine decarboxylase (pyruvate)
MSDAMTTSGNSMDLWNRRGSAILPTNMFVEPILERGLGSFVWDIDGKKYLDLNCGQFCLCFGHSYPPFIEAVRRQMEKITHTNTNTLSKVVFDSLQRLLDITQGLFQAGILLSTGAEAVEFALRFAKSISKKSKMLSLDCGYHGLSLGSQSVSTGGKWAIPRLPDSFAAPVPRSGDEVEACLAVAERILDENRDEIAAFIMEPILGAGGMIIPPIEFIQEVRSICDRHNVILIFDECQTGFGRTGKWFCYQTYEVRPDMLVFGKVCGAGFPVSGVLLTEKLAEGMRQGTQTHFSSHQNDPLPAAILLFVIEEMEKHHLLPRIAEAGDLLMREMGDIARRHPALTNPRGIGLMTAFDLDRNLFADGRNPGAELTNALLADGILIQSINRGMTFRVMPNYFVTQDEIQMFLECLEDAIGRLAA